jgi:hypothetical protein
VTSKEKEHADRILEYLGMTPFDGETDESTWAIDDVVILLGEGGARGKILEVHPELCLVKFPGAKASWIDKRLLLHYKTGD